ncbi:MAG: D-alanyl-D-alanine carboxypeptidase family protein [Gloeomargarita sp. SKYBB_i_bin120]|nr:D-alanyl-D-alanine carboxypeptidase family protein [Gloeomargarita sp. SKYG98]MCS7291737.1 D-alanyl-D-alanine carboxypeptidase family protein [Gloeomargarita sp. SKYB120]MDW8177297.1 D-alanyl-D-alanine carboxypeptidase family protein [Gloeomargarita sp. SKYBB_i_bin120]
MDDIPQARRQGPATVQKTPASGPRRWWVVFVIAGLGSFGLVGGWLFRPAPVAQESPPVANAPADLLGHLPYAEADPRDLQAVTADGRVKLHRDAAQAFLAMQRAAQADGVLLVPLSGFRSYQEQQAVFYDVKAERGQRVQERAKVSAPPGYSEHHTGYAIDIGDGRQPATHLHPSFAQTAAFAWLQRRAAQFHFEMSFPENNPQGISYEPWHWRFVGTPRALETFYRARSSTAAAPGR